MPATAALADEVYIKLKSNVTLAETKIRLKDIATVVSKVDSNSLQEYSVASLTDGDFPKTISRTDILVKILEKYPQLEGRIAWAGADKVVIAGHMQQISGETRLREASDWIVRQLRNTVNREVEPFVYGKVYSLGVPAGIVVQKPLFDQAKWRRGAVEIPVQILVNDRFYSTQILKFHLEYRDVVDITTPKDSDRTVSESSDSALPREYLTAGSGERELGVRKNQQVKLLITDGPIQIEGSGIAQDNAYVGDNVWVRRNDRDAAFIGEVTAPGMIAIRGEHE